MIRRLIVLFLSVATLSVPVSANQSSTPIPDGDGESRNTPYTTTQRGQVGDYDIKIVDVVPGAYSVVMAENQFNDPPEQGNVFFMVRVEATYTGQETGKLGSDLRFSVVGDQNRGYSENRASCGVVPDEAHDAPELFEDGSTEFNVCWSVPEEEVESLVMYIEPGFSFDDERIWFSLEESESDATATPSS